MPNKPAATQKLVKKEDHRTRLTKMMILNAMTGLLKEKPIQNITVKELCERAEINRGTFYLHYHDIYDLSLIHISVIPSPRVAAALNLPFL